MRDLFITPQFRKDFRDLSDFRIRMILPEVTELLRHNPHDRSLDIAKLKIVKGLWRVRIGAYRLVYSYDKSSLVLHRIRHRKDVYGNF